MLSLWYPGALLGIHLTPKDLGTDEHREFSSHISEEQAENQTASSQGISYQMRMNLRTKLKLESKPRSKVRKSLHLQVQVDSTGDVWEGTADHPRLR